MKIIISSALGLLLVGCNYSLSKTPLVSNLGGDGTGNIQRLPAGAVVSYPVVHSSILQPKCLECHSSSGGDAGGVNLESYERVIVQLENIKNSITSNSMPKNRAKLSHAEKEVLLSWISAGGPRNGGVAVPPQAPDPLPPVEPSQPDVVVLNYDKVNKEVLAPRCISCHSETGGNRGDVNLETYENVVALAPEIESAIQLGSMPRPRNKPLTAEQKELILKWLSMGAPK